MDDKHTAFLRRAFPAGTIYTYDEIEVLRKQENEMNTKVFEYCIVNFDEDEAPFIAIGPSAIAICDDENPRDAALLKIGCVHADIIDNASEVQIRPFC